MYQKKKKFPDIFDVPKISWLENLFPLICPLILQSLSIFVLYALVLKQYAWDKTKDYLCSQVKDIAVIQGNWFSTRQMAQTQILKILASIHLFPVFLWPLLKNGLPSKYAFPYHEVAPGTEYGLEGTMSMNKTVIHDPLENKCFLQVT